jgi:hypothetical protein
MWGWEADGEQDLLISKPAKILEYWITSANAKEPEINNISKFINYVKGWVGEPD